ncbi:unnamed protein product, partial [Meganyctiphanes norvegica]
DGSYPNWCGVMVLVIITLIVLSIIISGLTIALVCVGTITTGRCCPSVCFGCTGPMPLLIMCAVMFVVVASFSAALNIYSLLTLMLVTAIGLVICLVYACKWRTSVLKATSNSHPTTTDGATYDNATGRSSPPHIYETVDFDNATGRCSPPHVYETVDL